MADVKWEDNASFVPQAAVNPSDWIMGLKGDLTVNTKYTNATYLSYVQENITYQNVYNSSVIAGDAEFQLNGTDDYEIKDSFGNVIFNASDSGLQGLFGMQTFLISNTISSGGIIDSTMIGKLNVNTSGSNFTISATALTNFAIGSSFEMLVTGTGTLTFSCDPGVFLNGASGGSFTLSSAYSRAKITQVIFGSWAVSEYDVGGGGGNESLQETYDVGRFVTYAEDEPIEISVPDENTDGWITRNLKNAVVDNKITSHKIYGKDLTGTEFLYSEDQLLYTGTGNIRSGLRNLYVSEDGTLIKYMDLDGENSRITAHRNLRCLNVDFIAESDNVAEEPRYDFFMNNTGANNQTVGLLSSKSFTNNDVLKTSDVLRVRTSDSAEANFSQKLTWQAFSSGVLEDAITYDGVDLSTKIINPTTTLKEQVLTTSDLSLQSAWDGGKTINLGDSETLTVFDNEGNVAFKITDLTTGLNSVSNVETGYQLITTGEQTAPPEHRFKNTTNAVLTMALASVYIDAKTNTGVDVSSQFLKSNVTDPSNSTFSSNGELTIWDNGSLKVYIEADGSAGTIKVPNNTTKALDIVATLSDISGSAGQLVEVMGTVTAPVTSYTNGAWESVLGTISGTNVVPANTLEIGQAVEIEIVGVVNSIVSGGSGQFRALYGGFILGIGNTFSTTSNGATTWKLTYRITRINSAQVSIAWFGEWVDFSNNIKPIVTAVVPSAKNVTFTVNSAIDIEYLTTVAGGNTFSMIAESVKILKYN